LQVPGVVVVEEKEEEEEEEERYIVSCQKLIQRLQGPTNTAESTSEYDHTRTLETYMTV
jgi:hypothetical protein